MTSSDVIYKMTNFVFNKTQTGNVNPARFNLAMDISNRSLFKRYVGIVEVSGKGGQAIAFSSSTDVEKVLRLFKKEITLYIPTTGVCNVPSDFIRQSTLNYVAQSKGKVNYNPVKDCNDSEFQEAQFSYVVPATKENPVYRFVGNTIEFLPKDLVNVNMTYLRMPQTPVWGFVTTNNRPVYEPSTSVACEYPDDIIDDFLMLVLQFLGVAIDKQQLIGYTQQYKLIGQ